VLPRPGTGLERSQPPLVGHERAGAEHFRARIVRTVGFIDDLGDEFLRLIAPQSLERFGLRHI